MENAKLSDNAIAQIAKALQVAILTGTDIVDNLRQIRFVVTDDGNIELDPDYVEQFINNINSMLEDAENLDNKQLSLFD